MTNFSRQFVGFVLWLLLTAAAVGQSCPGGQCPTPWGQYGWQPARQIQQAPAASTVRVDAAAHCRVVVGGSTLGSGTLIDPGGLVLTCAHLFDGQSGSVAVIFSSGRRFAGRLVEIDRPHDLAALEIGSASGASLTVDAAEPSGLLTACGYGSSGQFRAVRGPIVGYALPQGASFPSVKFDGAVRPGDSGGGVLDERGQLVGVVWGARDGVTYATCGQPLRRFLDRLRDWRTGPSSPGMVPVQPVPPPAQSPIAEQQPTVTTPDWLLPWRDDVDGRLASLEGAAGEYARVDDVPAAPDLSDLASRREVDSKLGSLADHLRDSLGNRVGFFEGLSLGKLLVGALGISGPLGAAIVIAAGLVGRRAKQRLTGRGAGVRGEGTFHGSKDTNL